MMFIENAVTIADIAAVTKKKAADVKAEAVELNFTVGCDWAGRPAVAARDAQQLTSGEARRTREHESAWASHLAECKAWMSRRDAAVRSAREAATSRSAVVGGRDFARVQEAGDEAGKSYELGTPVPLWQGTDTGNATRLYTDRTADSLLKRIARRGVKVGVR